MVELEIAYNGTKRWYRVNDMRYHRLNGPAICYPNGAKWYFQYGYLHRLDGPAIEGTCYFQWYYNNHKVECDNQQDFERLIKLRLLW